MVARGLSNFYIRGAFLFDERGATSEVSREEKRSLDEAEAKRRRKERSDDRNRRNRL